MAKRIISVILALLVLAAFIGATLYGCTKRIKESPDEAQSERPDIHEQPQAQEHTPQLSDYAVFPENTVYIYEGDSSSFNDWHVFISYVGGGVAQKLFMMSYATTVEVISYSGGELKQIYGDAVLSSEGRIPQTDARGQQPTADIVLLKEPLAVGTSWVQSELAGDGAISSITSIDKDIITPYGALSCVEVTTIFEEGVAEERDYYAKDIGLVMVVSLIDGEERTSALSQIMTGQTVSEAVAIFYPGDTGENSGEAYETIRLEFSTNDAPQALFKAAAVPRIKELLGVDLSDVEINGITIDAPNRMARVDFNQAAVKHMNETPDQSTEELIIQCVTDTLAYLLGVDSIAYTIDGGDYMSDKFSFGADDYVTVNMKESREE